MDEKTIQRIKKLQALAERGVGGEKTTAQKKLAKLLKDNGINSLDELQKEEYEYTIFSYNGKHEIKLLRQCMYKVMGGKLRGKEIKTMSEVYIRSQNKEKLYRLGGNYACVEYGEYEDIKKKRGGAEADKKRHVICISDGCLEEIGEYATKERCLEVLDEIQKACVSYLFTAGGAAVIRGGMDVQPFAAVIPRLYEMPEK